MEAITKAIQSMDHFKKVKPTRGEHIPVDFTIGYVWVWDIPGSPYLKFTKDPHLDLRDQGTFVCEFFNGALTPLKYWKNNVYLRNDSEDYSKVTHRVENRR